MVFSYYLLFAECYSICLRQADVLMVNSSWTKGHVNRLLRPFGWRDDADDPEDIIDPTVVVGKQETTLRNRGKEEVVGKVGVRTKKFKTATIVYPPCDTLSLASLPLSRRENIILSVAQFRSVSLPLSLFLTNLMEGRPEKEHHVQLHALKTLLDHHPSFRTGPDRVKLILAGSVRNEGDEARVTSLRSLSLSLSISVRASLASTRTR